MNSRERVLAAIEHREPDRVPVDLGGTIMSGIMAEALVRLRRHMKLEPRPVKVYDTFQMLGEVEMDVVEALSVDVLPVEPHVLWFGLRNENYKPWKLFDGTEVLVPGQFQVEIAPSGDWLLHEGGDPGKPIVARMPHGGYYFDLSAGHLDHLDFQPPSLTEMEKQYAQPIPKEKMDFLAAKAQRLRKTGKALVLGDWHDFGPPEVGTMGDWLCLMATDGDYVQRLFEIRTAAVISRLEALYAAVGDTIDILGVDGADYGTQRSEMFSPAFFERFYLPYYCAVNSWVHQHTPWKTWKHSCGSITKLLPLLVESGLDIINPVQCSAEGMGPAWLKKTFGDKITFWGGAVDTQKTLPFGIPEEVYRQAAERISTFAPGGGFVFNAVHNIQARTPAENIAAMFRCAQERGRYPIIT